VNYFLRILPEAEKQLLRLNSPFYESVKRKISSLGDNPRPPGCRKLKGRQAWRLRAGDYRIVYEIDDGSRTVSGEGSSQECCVRLESFLSLTFDFGGEAAAVEVDVYGVADVYLR
jgi:mRNA interferase RelE/StbE